MFYIPVILGSTRRERQSVKAAKFIIGRMRRDSRIETEILDLLEFDFPIMDERLRFRDDPPARLPEFADKIERADSLVIVSPEYNHGYPGVLKNALDYLLPEYERKPFGFVTASAGSFGGVNCLAQLQLISLGMGAFPIPSSLSIPKIQDAIDAEGEPRSPALDGLAKEFIEELLWFTEAVVNQKARERRAA